MRKPDLTQVREGPGIRERAALPAVFRIGVSCGAQIPNFAVIKALLTLKTINQFEQLSHIEDNQPEVVIINAATPRACS